MINSLWEALAVLLAGFAAGTINAVVASGSLVTFPMQLACGLPPVTANVSNNIGMAPGSLSAVFGYRAELSMQRPRVLRLGIVSLVGAVIGAILLLTVPQGAFQTIVPVLIAIGVLLVVFGPPLQRRVAAQGAARGEDAPQESRGLRPVVALTGVYGGYFGTAQGVILLAVLGIGTTDTMQRQNAVKNVLVFLVNGIAAVVFLLAAPSIDWRAVVLLALGSAAGAQAGAALGRRLPPIAFRACVAVVGVIAIAALVF